MKTNQDGIEIIKKFEGCKLSVYRCPAGLLTAGWGHRITDKKYQEGQAITQEMADLWFKDDIYNIELQLNTAISNNSLMLTENEFSALVSLIYNVGFGAFLGSRMWKKIQAGQFVDAAKEFIGWDHVGGKQLLGLTIRREAERKLFLEPMA